MQMRVKLRSAWDDFHTHWVAGVDTRFAASKRCEYLGVFATL